LFRGNIDDAANQSANAAPELKFAVMENSWKICIIGLFSKYLNHFDVKDVQQKNNKTLVVEYLPCTFGLGSEVADDRAASSCSPEDWLL